MDPDGGQFPVAVCPGQPAVQSPHGALVAPPHGPSRHGMQLQARSYSRSAIYSQGMRRSGRDTCNGARTSCTQRGGATTHWREEHQHAHCVQQTRPRLLCRIAAYACTLASPRMSVRSMLRIVADDLLRLRRLTAVRAEDGLHERCSVLVTVNLQLDE